MPFYNQIIDHINQQLKVGALAKGQVLGMSTILQKEGRLTPAYEENGTYQEITPDDRYPWICYHKTISNTYSLDKASSHGEDYVTKCVSEMALVVLQDTRKLPGDLEVMLLALLPKRLPASLQRSLRLSSCLIVPQSSYLDKIMVFRQEYAGHDFFLKPYHNLFYIRYRIESSFNQACLQQCLCGDV